MSIDLKIKLTDMVFSSIRGLGILDSILSDDSITEVMINGPDNIFIEKTEDLLNLIKNLKAKEGFMI